MNTPRDGQPHAVTANLLGQADAALALAHQTQDVETLDDLHRALLALAGAYEVTSPPDLPTVATWYALDAAAAVWDAARREEAIARGQRDPVRYAPRLLPLEAAGHAILTAHAALANAATPVHNAPNARPQKGDEP